MPPGLSAWPREAGVGGRAAAAAGAVTAAAARRSSVPRSVLAGEAPRLRLDSRYGRGIVGGLVSARSAVAYARKVMCSRGDVEPLVKRLDRCCCLVNQRRACQLACAPAARLQELVITFQHGV